MTPGYCECGCGQRTRRIEKSNRARGLVRGAFRRFVQGHGVNVRWRERGPQYLEAAKGFSTPCWIWQWSTDGRGYGSLNRQKAHRIYYERTKGPIPPGLELDHLCRQRLCVNPDHLEAVTHTENVRRGAATRLTESQVREIRASTDSNRSLARRFGVSNVQVHKIKSRESWGWLP